MDKLKALLAELKQDDYVRFKYGKALEAALKQLDAQQAVDLKLVERQLVAALEAVRQPGPKSKAKEAPRAS